MESLLLTSSRNSDEKKNAFRRTLDDFFISRIVWWDWVDEWVSRRRRRGNFVILILFRAFESRKKFNCHFLFAMERLILAVGALIIINFHNLIWNLLSTFVEKFFTSILPEFRRILGAQLKPFAASRRRTRRRRIFFVESIMEVPTLRENIHQHRRVTTVDDGGN